MAELNRRDFVKTAGTVAGAAAVGHWSSADGQAETTSAGMIYRTLGKTGERVSAIGLGGYHIGKPSITEPDSIALIRKAIDSGITFSTTAGITTTARAKCAWAKRWPTGTGTRCC